MPHSTITPETDDILDTLLEAFGTDALNALQSDVELIELEEEGASRSLDVLVAELDQSLEQSPAPLAAGAMTNAAAARRSTEVRHIVVQWDHSQVAIPMSHVVEVQRVPAVTAIPFVPDWLRGVTNLRGEIVSVIDGRLFLGLPAADHGLLRRLVIVRSLQEDLSTGLIVDRVVGLRGMHPERIRPPTGPTESRLSSFLSGVCAEEGSEAMGVLDLERFFQSEELRQFDAV